MYQIKIIINFVIEIINLRSPVQDYNLCNKKMTNKQLFGILREFVPGITSANIVKSYPLENQATLLMADLHLNDDNAVSDVMRVPFVHYEGKDWLMTPFDWQDDNLSNITPDTIQDISWRVDSTETEAVIFDGLPMLPMWAEDPTEIKQYARKAVGAMIKEARKANGLTTRQLAEKCGLSNSHITRIESGRYAVTIDSIALIAKALGLQIKLV